MSVDIDLWVVLAILGVVVALYFITMRIFFKQSEETYKKVDYSKVRKIKDEED